MKMNGNEGTGMLLMTHYSLETLIDFNRGRKDVMIKCCSNQQILWSLIWEHLVDR